MQAKFIFKDTETGQELVLPVTPKEYEIEHGRRVNSLTMQTVGEVNFTGPEILFNTELSCLLPAHPYPFCQPGAGTNPWVYLERLERWSDAGTVLRFVISDCPVNAPVKLGPVRYREQDGTGDLYCTLALRRYRELKADEYQAAETGNGARAVEMAPVKPDTYTVQAGDTLSGICRSVYGDGGLYGRLAAANGIQNPNLIYPGQILKLPPRGKLPAAKPPGPSQAAAESTETKKDQGTGQLQMKLPQERAQELLHNEGGLASVWTNTAGRSKDGPWQ